MAPSSLVPKLPLENGILTQAPVLKSCKELVAQASRLCGIKRLAGDIRCAVRTLHGGHGGPPHRSSLDPDPYCLVSENDLLRDFFQRSGKGLPKELWLWLFINDIIYKGF